MTIVFWPFAHVLVGFSDNIKKIKLKFDFFLYTSCCKSGADKKITLKKTQKYAWWARSSLL